MRYRYIDHTADMGLEIYGRDLEELFRNASFALFDNITELRKIEEKDKRRIRLSSESLKELLLDWFRELLFLFGIEFFITKRVRFLNLKERELEAEIWGERFDKKRHKIKMEIKNPTYHTFSLERYEKGYKARVVFDV